jgi:hypothetical protein
MIYKSHKPVNIDANLPVTLTRSQGCKIAHGLTTVPSFLLVVPQKRTASADSI